MKILQSVLRLTPFLVSAFALSNSVSVAELPQEYYQELKSKAPEVLTIKVVSADVTDFINVFGGSATEGCIKLPSKHICAQAEVTAVDHSESGLKPGSIIEIVYTVEVLGENYATAGAAEVLEKAMVRRAYLKQGSWGDTGFDSSYDVAARGQSFENIK